MDNPAELVRRFWDDVWAAGKLDEIDELFADRYVRHNPSGTRSRTRAEIRQDVVQYRRAIRAVSARIEDSAVAGDRVWTRLTVKGVSLETQEPITSVWLQVHRIEDGRLAEVWQLNAVNVDWKKK